MATFHIHQDADKENPQNMPVKESLLGHKQAHAVGGTKQPLSVIGGTGNINVPRMLNAPASKIAFREATNVTNNKVIQDTGDTKKSNVVPVVEQFKTFSVYEDCSDEVTTKYESSVRTEKISNQIFVDKENVNEPITKPIKKQTKIDLKSSDVLHREFNVNEDDYILDTTSMSVSDVLSPMSVDHSQLSISSVKIIDDSNCSSTIAEHTKGDSKALDKSKDIVPRNDRQRFFEVVEYQHSILEYFRESEKKHRPKPHYMRRQTDITYAMRTILVDWLVEVSEEYNLDTETLYLSVSYIDRFLSHMSVVRNKLQLVGTAAMYIASKYEEIYPPDVGEFVFITDDTYTKSQVLRMEQIILKILAFDLCTPTAYVYINTYAVLCDIPDEVKYLTQYISELSLLEADPYLRFYPSIISAASLALASYLVGNPIWSPEMEEITTYRLEDLKEVLLYLCKSHKAAATLPQQAIQDKYKAEKYKKVSTIPGIELTESCLDEIIREYNEQQKEKSEKCKTSSATGTTPKGNLILFK